MRAACQLNSLLFGAVLPVFCSIDVQLGTSRSTLQYAAKPQPGLNQAFDVLQIEK
jgi:hypothetical protein